MPEGRVGTLCDCTLLQVSACFYFIISFFPLLPIKSVEMSP